MKKVTFLLAAILVLGVSSIAKAQNNGNGNGNGNSPAQEDPTAAHALNISISSYSMIGLAGSNQALAFEASAAEVAGDKVVFTQSSGSTSLWLNYSAIAEGENTYKVTAKVTGDAHDGLDVKVNVSSASTGGAGETGTGAGEIILTSTESDVVTGIGSCYTGAGEELGHELTYSVSANEDNYGDIAASSPSLIVTYTITDEN